MKGSQQHWSLCIRDLQIKAHKMLFQFTRLATIEKSDNPKCWNGVKQASVSMVGVGGDSSAHSLHYRPKSTARVLHGHPKPTDHEGDDG